MDKKAKKAQAMVEFALTLPILLVLMFGIIEFGRLMFAYVSVYTAAHEASRFGTANGFELAENTITIECDEIIAKASSYGFINVITTNVYVEYWITDPAYAPAVVYKVYYVNGDELPECTGTSYTISSDKIKDELRYRPRLVVTSSTTFTPIAPVPGLNTITITSTSRRTMVGPIFLRTK
jgi:Flp pilus assembly protein TadG